MEPQEKQQLHDISQPDAQLEDSPPPASIVYPNIDPIVSGMNAYRLAESLIKVGASVKLQVFADAPHGFALDTMEQPVSDWPEMCKVGWCKPIV